MRGRIRAMWLAMSSPPIVLQVEETPDYAVLQG
jgi:hypothetical protein